MYRPIHIYVQTFNAQMHTLRPKNIAQFPVHVSYRVSHNYCPNTKFKLLQRIRQQLWDTLYVYRKKECLFTYIQV